MYKSNTIVFSVRYVIIKELSNWVKEKTDKVIPKSSSSIVRKDMYKQLHKRYFFSSLKKKRHNTTIKCEDLNMKIHRRERRLKKT